nr:NADH dehydrogenase subunit 4L [Multinervis sp.]
MSWVLVLLMYLFGIFSLIFIKNHILLSLMSLEFIVLYLLYFIYMYCLVYEGSFYLYVFLMTFFVCEGVLGLSLLVFMIRTHGNDYLNSLFMW